MAMADQATRAYHHDGGVLHCQLPRIPISREVSSLASNKAYQCSGGIAPKGARSRRALSHLRHTGKTQSFTRPWLSGLKRAMISANVDRSLLLTHQPKMRDQKADIKKDLIYIEILFHAKCQIRYSFGFAHGGVGHERS